MKSPEFESLKISYSKPITISKILSARETLGKGPLDFFNATDIARFIRRPNHRAIFENRPNISNIGFNQHSSITSEERTQ